jgi:hypothetical protein
MIRAEIIAYGAQSAQRKVQSASCNAQSVQRKWQSVSNVAQSVLDDAQ